MDINIYLYRHDVLFVFGICFEFATCTIDISCFIYIYLYGCVFDTSYVFLLIYIYIYTVQLCVCMIIFERYVARMYCLFWTHIHMHRFCRVSCSVIPLHIYIYIYPLTAPRIPFFRSVGHLWGRRTMNQLGRSCSRWLKFGLWGHFGLIVWGWKMLKILYEKWGSSSNLFGSLVPCSETITCALHLHQRKCLATLFRKTPYQRVKKHSKSEHSLHFWKFGSCVNYLPPKKGFIPNHAVRWCWSSEANPKHFKSEFAKVWSVIWSTVRHWNLRIGYQRRRWFREQKWEM